MPASLLPVPAELARERAREPIVAWRSWALTGRRDGTGLLLRPVAGRARPWPPGVPAEARCRINRFHHAPEVGCTCGLHASHTLDILRRTKCPAVLGRVALWGLVVEHDLGFRARFGYPQRLRLICQFCFWQWGPLGSAPQVVGWFTHGQLVPFCEEHLATAAADGVTPRCTLPADAIDQALRERYAVDLLPP